MRKLITAVVVLVLCLNGHNCLLSAQACAISPKLTDTWGFGKVHLCASPGASCSPALNGGGPGQCQKSDTLIDTNILCGCFSRGKDTKADPAVDVAELVEELSAAKPGDVLNFDFTAADLTHQHTFLFVPNLFNAHPNVLSMRITVKVNTVIQDADNEFHLLFVSITGNQVFSSFNVTGFGSTGLNTQIFVGGTVVFDVKNLLFDGTVTSALTNNIWTTTNPITLAEEWGGSLDPIANTVTFETTAPGKAFVVPAIQPKASSVLFPPKPEAKELTGVERAKLEWFEKVRHVQ